MVNNEGSKMEPNGTQDEDKDKQESQVKTAH